MDEQGTHFWTMAIQMSTEMGRTDITGGWGTWTPGKGQTRYDIFQEIRASLSEKYPQCAGGAVIAFDIQPNEL